MALGVSLAGASTLVACGGGSGDGSFEGEALNVLIIQPHAGSAETLKRGFKEATGADVNFTVVPYDQVRSKAALDAQSGAGEFDVYEYWYVSVGELADTGALEDLTERIEGDRDLQTGDFIESIYDPYTLYEGGRYGLPFDGDTHILFYNKEVLERNGVEPPGTWDDYARAAEKITKAEKDNGIYGAALLGKKTPMDLASMYTNRLAGFNGAYMTEDGGVALDDDAAVAAAQALLDAQPHVLPTAIQTSFSEALPAWLDGKIAMMEFWTDLGVYSDDPQESKMVDKWGAAQLPTADGAESLSALDSGFGFGVSAAAQNPDLAWEFVKYCALRDTNLDLITTRWSGIDPTRRSTLDASGYKEFAPDVQEATRTSLLRGAIGLPTIPQAPELVNRLNDNLTLLLQGESTPQEAVSATREAWQQTLDA